MHKLLIFIFVTYFLSINVSAEEITLVDLKNKGLKAYEGNDCIGAIKYLYAYRVSDNDLSPDKLKSIDSAISYCEKSLSNLNAILQEGSSSGYLSISNGKVKPINVGSSGVLITIDDQVIPLDTSSGGVLITSDGVMMEAPEQIDSILWSDQSVEYPSLNSANDFDVLLKRKKIEIDTLNKYKKLYENQGAINRLTNKSSGTP